MEKIINPLFSVKYTYVEGGNKSDDGMVGKHDYVVKRIGDDAVLAEIHFQQGPIKEDGINGVNNEDLILMVIDRLENFQSGPFACRENDMALTNLEQAVMWLRNLCSIQTVVCAGIRSLSSIQRV